MLIRISWKISSFKCLYVLYSKAALNIKAVDGIRYQCYIFCVHFIFNHWFLKCIEHDTLLCHSDTYLVHSWHVMTLFCNTSSASLLLCFQSGNYHRILIESSNKNSVNVALYIWHANYLRIGLWKQTYLTDYWIKD